MEDFTITIPAVYLSDELGPSNGSLLQMESLLRRYRRQRAAAKIEQLFHETDIDCIRVEKHDGEHGCKLHVMYKAYPDKEFADYEDGQLRAMGVSPTPSDLLRDIEWKVIAYDILFDFPAAILNEETAYILMYTIFDEEGLVRRESLLMEHQLSKAAEPSAPSSTSKPRF
jgi:hypothetical protein